jgi:hypothetical protein
LEEVGSYFFGVDSHQDDWFQSDELPAKHQRLYESIRKKIVGLLPSYYLRAFRVFFPHLANNIENRDQSKRGYLPPSSAPCFNAFKYNGNDEIYGLVALAVAQQATVRRNSTFWNDKGGDGGLGYYVYEEDTDRELDENPAANHYRHTLGIEPKTWLSRNYQEVMRWDFDTRLLKLKPDKEGDPVLANYVQMFSQVRSSLLFCSTMIELSTIVYMEIHHGALDFFQEVFQKISELNGEARTKSW